MPLYLAAGPIRDAIRKLEGTSPRGRLLSYLVGMRTLALASTPRVGVAEGVAAYREALHQLAFWPAQRNRDEELPFFNPFDPAGQGFKGVKFTSNGPGNTIHGWTREDSPFEIHGDVRPKEISKRAADPRGLQKFLLGQPPYTNRPRLIDIAMWLYRSTDLDEAASGIAPARAQVEERVIADLGLGDDEIRLLFRREAEDIAGELPVLSFQSDKADPRLYIPEAPTGTARTSRAAASTTRGRADTDLAGPVVDFIRSHGYTFEPWQIATFITAVRTKPFVILAGISGTGKTRLPRLVSEATGARSVVVPVRPDWTDSSDLLGYERLDGTFVPGHLLRIAREAIANPDLQYFFVLDEMNIARVEYYFAEVLSLMENRRNIGGNIMTDPLQPAATGEIDGINWSDVHLPSNVAIIGTVNMDETTHGFSRKVLDRAFVIELTDVDLENLGEVDSDVAEAKPVQWSARKWRAEALRLAEREESRSDYVMQAISVLVEANRALEPAQLHVGYRVRDEVALFCLAARESADSFVDQDGSVVSPLDLSLCMKVLPRVQGGGALVRDVLDGLVAWMMPATVADPDSVDRPSIDNDFPRSLRRVQLMQNRLEQTGFTSYWV